jgi:hypothetical protein
MKKAKIVLAMSVFFLLMSGILAFKTMRGLNNLYLVTSGTFYGGGASRVLSYATLSPYRTFYTIPSQATTTTAISLFTSTTLTWTTIGGIPNYYVVTAGLPWTGAIYDDEDQ